MALDKNSLNSIPVHQINDSDLDAAGVSLSILRCDLIHPELSGNKWFKLKYNLLAAKEQGYDTLLSFGGAWSNHLHALAAAGKLFDFNTIGVIRGEATAPLNPCLSDAVGHGMKLHWVSREEYRNKKSADFINALKAKFGRFFLIPEGGSGLAGITGCQEIIQAEQVNEYDLICLACGTGTTLAGIVSAACPPVLGFQVLKGKGYLASEVESLLSDKQLLARNSWSINDTYHFGGYGKVKPELLTFIANFEERTNIPLEPVYSGKMLFGLYDLIKQDYFQKNTRVLVVHGGGLQGARGFI